ncbi:MAG: hypothetical protein OEV42_20990 [Deltaproteobacteria bacterium]|nr:hypothetical protein [Deltaproteobacteria bacterium]
MKYIIYKEKLELYKPENPESEPGSVMQTENPDFDDLYRHVNWWYLEIDDYTKKVNREIGLDKDKNPIVLAPWGCNYGLWVDSVAALERIEFEETTETDFEEKWIAMEEKLAHY